MNFFIYRKIMINFNSFAPFKGDDKIKKTFVKRKYTLENSQ